MSTRPALLPFVASAPLVDHHCHGVLGATGPVEPLLNEASGAAATDGMALDSLAGLALRKWCPPLLGLPAHAPAVDYQARRDALGGPEVNRRFLRACGLSALCADTGFAPADLLSPAETAGFAGAAAFEVVRLEQVAESLGLAGVTAADFPGEYRTALAERISSPANGVPAVAVKSIAAYRVGLALEGRRPTDAEAAAAAARWLGGDIGDGTGGGGRDGGRTSRDGSGGGRDGGGTGGGSGHDGDQRLPRLADEVLHRFFIWCGADLGMPIQFHVGYGDRDLDLHRCNPLLLTELLRALEPAGVPVMLLHNYPYHREAGYLAQVFPHVYVDLGLAAHNVGCRAPEVLAEALELVPLRKFLYSSDAFGLPELYYLGSLQFRQALSAFLQARLDADDMSVADAERITSLIASQNARRAYRLEL